MNVALVCVRAHVSLCTCIICVIFVYMGGGGTCWFGEMENLVEIAETNSSKEFIRLVMGFPISYRTASLRFICRRKR